MKNNLGAAKITFSAMVISVFVIMHFVFPANNRGVQSVLGTVTPIPIAVYSYRYNIRNTIVIIFVGIFLSMLFFDPILVISFIVPSLLFGVVLGAMLKNEYLIARIIVLALLSICFNIYEMYINYLVTGIDFIEFNVMSIHESIKILKTFFQNLNEQIIFDLNVVIMPLMIIVGGTIKAMITYYLSTFIIGRLFGKQLTSRNIFVCLSNTIIIDAVFLGLYISVIIIWLLVLTDTIKYLFIYSILLDIALLCMIVYYGIIHQTLTVMFRDNKIKLMLISILLISMFFIISPIYACKKIMSVGGNHERS